MSRQRGRRSTAAIGCALAIGAMLAVGSGRASAAGGYAAAPLIVTPPVIDAYVGQPFSLFALATGTPAPTSVVTASGPLPAGLKATNPGITGTPQPGSEGTYQLSVTASNGVPPDATRTITLVVDPAGTAPPPQFLPISYDVDEPGNPVVTAPAGTLTGNQNGITTSLLSGPTQGRVTVGADGSFSYVPDAALVYWGGMPASYDQFAYTGCWTGTANCQTNVVTLLIVVSPTARADRYGTPAGVPLSPAAPGVLGNDSAPDGGPLTAALDTGPSHGTLSLAPDGSFVYVPAAGYTGVDSFTYTANETDAYGDVFTSSPSEVTIRVGTACKPGEGDGEHHDGDSDRGTIQSHQAGRSRFHSNALPPAPGHEGPVWPARQ